MRKESASRATTAGPGRQAPWFRARSTGGGFVPCAWQGWLLVATMPAALMACRSIAGPGWALIARDATGATLISTYLLVISLTGGRTIWNWVFRFGR